MRRLATVKSLALASLMCLSLSGCHNQSKSEADTLSPAPQQTQLPPPNLSSASPPSPDLRPDLSSSRPAELEQLTILALGDSYTIGQGLGPESRWPVLLAHELGSQQAPQIIAQTGWTTQNLIQALLGTDLAPHWDLVTLMIGVNNQYQGRPLSEYHQQFETLLKQALAAAPKPSCVLVVSIPDWGATPFAAGQDRLAIGKQIAEFNAVNLALSQAYQTSYLDITPLSRDLADTPERVAPDGLHYSREMHQLWAERAARLLKTDCLAPIKN